MKRISTAAMGFCALFSFAPAQAELSAADAAGVRSHVQRFWHKPAEDSSVRVRLRISVDQDGTVRDAQVEETTGAADESLRRSYAESARRAVRLASPLPVSRGMSAQVFDVVLGGEDDGMKLPAPPPSQTATGETSRKKVGQGRPSDQSRGELCDQAAVTGRLLSASDLGELLEMIGRANLRKGEYEKTPDFKEREAREVPKIRAWVSSRLGSPLIAVASRALGPAEINYDADSEVMTLKFTYGYAAEENHYSYPALKPDQVISVLSRASRDVGSYEGVNGFGVRKEIVKQETTVAGIAIGPTGWPKRDVIEKIKVPPKEAEVLRKSAMVLYVAELVAPYSMKYSRTSTPTITSPYDDHTAVSAVVAKPLCVGIYDPAKKTVLRHLPLK